MNRRSFLLGSAYQAGARLNCIVIGCRRTADAAKYPPHTRIICGKCWRLSSPALRRRIRRLEKVMRKLGAIDANHDWTETEPSTRARWSQHLHHKLFDQIAGEAFETRAGLR